MVIFRGVVPAFLAIFLIYSSSQDGILTISHLTAGYSGWSAIFWSSGDKFKDCSLTFLAFLSALTGLLNAASLSFFATGTGSGVFSFGGLPLFRLTGSGAVVALTLGFTFGGLPLPLLGTSINLASFFLLSAFFGLPLFNVCVCLRGYCSGLFPDKSLRCCDLLLAV